MDEAKQGRRLGIRIVIVCVAILLVANFVYAFRSSSGPVTLTVLPEVPRKGEPVIVTLS